MPVALCHCFGACWTSPEPATHRSAQKPAATLCRFVALFGASAITFVTAGREFIGRDWIAWLLSEKVPFRIRIKAGEWLRHEDGRERRASEPLVRLARLCVQKAAVLAVGVARVRGRQARLRRGQETFLVLISSARISRTSLPTTAYAGKSRRCFRHSRAVVSRWSQGA